MMEQKYTCNPNELTQSRITFWVYAVSIPIIIFLFLLPFIRTGEFRFSIASIAYIAIIGFLCYQTYRTYCVMHATKNSYCEIKDGRISGVSTPSPFKKSIPFEIGISEILGIGKVSVPIGGMREFQGLALNTKHQKIILFAIDRIDTLRSTLQSYTEASEK